MSKSADASGASQSFVRERSDPVLGSAVQRGQGRETRAALREVALGALARTAGSPLVEGNGVRVLHDAPENYPAWEEAIASARRSVHIEMYIFRPDRWGTRFAALLAGRAAAGVRVNVLCDWFGC